MVELDAHVVDAHAAKRGQQVLDGLDRRLARDQTCLKLLALAEVADVRRNLNPAKVGATEPDTKICGGRNEGEGDLLAGMETDSRASHGSAKGALRRHLVQTGTFYSKRAAS